MALMSASCVVRPDFETERASRFQKESKEIDSLLSEKRIVDYARVKTLLRMAATVSSSTTQLKATGEIVRRFADILDNPNIEVLMQNPTIWFDAALEWDVAYATIRSTEEDQYPALLNSCGEADFWASHTETDWSSSWEHLLLALAWELGEDREIAFYELIHVDPDELGFNEFSVLACWIVSMKMDSYGFHSHARLYRQSAKQILMDPRFDPCGCLRVSWMGTAKEDVRTSMENINTLLSLVSETSYSSPVSASVSATKLMNLLNQQPTDKLSEFHVIADFLLDRLVPEYQPRNEHNEIVGIPLIKSAKSRSILSRVLFGAYLTSWVWESYMDNKVLSGLSGIPSRLFRLMNTIGRVGDELNG